MMVDTISKERRSWNMSRIRGKNTTPEILLRSMLHRSGYRFRLHNRKLPGRPDVVLPKYHAVVFVNGCFWHQHEGCSKAYMPKTRMEFWKSKFKDTVERDKRKAAELNTLGWKVIIVWECQLNNNPQGVLMSLCSQLNEVA